jgi:hypothetical protein
MKYSSIMKIEIKKLSFHYIENICIFVEIFHYG